MRKESKSHRKIKAKNAHKVKFCWITINSYLKSYVLSFHKLKFNAKQFHGRLGLNYLKMSRELHDQASHHYHRTSKRGFICPKNFSVNI